MKKILRQAIPDDLADKLLRSVGFAGIHDRTELVRMCIKEDLFEEAITELWAYYQPCHAKKFLERDLTEHNIITIIRHVLRSRGQNLIPKERKHDYNSYTTYRISPADNAPVLPAPNFCCSFE